MNHKTRFTICALSLDILGGNKESWLVLFDFLEESGIEYQDCRDTYELLPSNCIWEWFPSDMKLDFVSLILSKADRIGNYGQKKCLRNIKKEFSKLRRGDISKNRYQISVDKHIRNYRRLSVEVNRENYLVGLLLNYCFHLRFPEILSTVASLCRCSHEDLIREYLQPLVGESRG